MFSLIFLLILVNNPGLLNILHMMRIWPPHEGQMSGSTSNIELVKNALFLKYYIIKK